MDVISWVILTVVGLLLWRLFRPTRESILINKIPGPPAYPLLGNLLDLLVPREELVPLLQKRVDTYGGILRTWLGPILPAVHIASPEYMETILSSNKLIKKGTLYKFLYPWLGTGLLTSAGQKWFTHRKLITPTFHFKILDNFIPVFNENSDVLVKKLEAKAKTGEEFDVYPFITLCALDIICETAMGTKVHAQEKSQSTYVTSIYSLSYCTTQRSLRPWLHPDFIFHRTAMGKQYLKDLKTVHGFTETVIEERKRLRVQRRKSSLREDDVGTKKREAFLDLLLDASGDDENSKLTDDELREEVDTFMFEGHDTTTAGMCWTLFLLGQYPEIQEKTFQELKDIFEDDPSRQPTMKDLGEMKMLERVIKESLRIYPSVPLISRELEEDIKLGGYDVPAGTNVVLHFLFLHRNPKLYPDPEKFDPDRFLPDNSKDRHPYAYVPFSAGSRNCIGQKFALLEEKAILSAIIRNYKIEATQTQKEIKVISELVLRPFSGIKLKITKRI